MKSVGFLVNVFKGFDNHYRWEKQELERQIRDLKKTNDELHRQNKRRGSLTRSASTEKEEHADKDGKTVTDDLGKLKADKDELSAKVKDVRVNTVASNLDGRRGYSNITKVIPCSFLGPNKCLSYYEMTSENHQAKGCQAVTQGVDSIISCCWHLQGRIRIYSYTKRFFLAIETVHFNSASLI